MATELQQTILDAMDIVVNSRLQNIKRDKTVQATIESCENVSTNLYKAKYKNGYILAYADNKKSYKKNDEVYIVVPEGDFSNRKIILGLLDETQNDKEVLYINQLLDKYQPLDKNIVQENQEKTIISLSSFQPSSLVEYNAQTINHILRDKNEYLENIKKANAIMIQATFSTSLPQEHIQQAQGNYGIVLATEKTDKIKSNAYVFDISKMLGNPYTYSLEGVQQTYIFPFDPAKFTSFDRLYFFANDFVTQQPTQDVVDNIFISNLKIQFLEEKAIQNDTYQMHISTPNGSSLIRTGNEKAKIDVNVSVSNPAGLDLTADCNFYWAHLDNSITKTSELYDKNVGEGWKKLDLIGNHVIITEDMCPETGNYFQVIAFYKNKKIVEDKVIIYNKNIQNRVQMATSKQKVVANTQGHIVDCNIIDTSYQKDAKYEFFWSLSSSKNGKVLFDEHIHDASADSNIIDQTKKDLFNDYTFKTTQKDNLPPKQSLTFPVGEPNVLTLGCTVLKNGELFGSDALNVFVVPYNAGGQDDYFILFDNDEQQFVYDANGFLTPSYCKPKSITCHFYKPLADGQYEETTSEALEGLVSWSLKQPDNKENSLIILENTENHSNTVSFTVKNKYNINALSNSQLVCSIQQNEQIYRQETNLQWLFMGEPGTSGTGNKLEIRPNNIYQEINKSKDELKTTPVYFGQNQLQNNVVFNVNQQVLYATYQDPVTKITYTDFYPLVAGSNKILHSNYPKYVMYDKYGNNPVLPQQLGFYFDEPCTITYKDKTDGWKFEVQNQALVLVGVPAQKTENVHMVEFTVNGMSITAPIVCVANRYDSNDLNNWDGNKVQVNDNKYILAPKFSVGKKELDNTFSGLTLGTEKTETTETTGMFGYKSGDPTLRLDAETGKLELGKPGKGQIVLDPDPNGEDKIGNWVFTPATLKNLQPVSPNKKPDNKENNLYISDFRSDQTGIVLRASDDTNSHNGAKISLRSKDGTTELVIDPNSPNFFMIYNRTEKEKPNTQTLADTNTNDVSYVPIIGVQNGQLYLSNNTLSSTNNLVMNSSGSVDDTSETKKPLELGSAGFKVKNSEKNSNTGSVGLLYYNAEFTNPDQNLEGTYDKVHGELELFQFGTEENVDTGISDIVISTPTPSQSFIYNGNQTYRPTGEKRNLKIQSKNLVLDNNQTSFEQSKKVILPTKNTYVGSQSLKEYIEAQTSASAQLTDKELAELRSLRQIARLANFINWQAYSYHFAGDISKANWPYPGITPFGFVPPSFLAETFCARFARWCIVKWKTCEDKISNGHSGIVLNNPNGPSGSQGWVNVNASSNNPVGSNADGALGLWNALPHHAFSEARAGDFLVFNYGSNYHVGIVVKKISNTKVRIIEGNYNIGTCGSRIITVGQSTHGDYPIARPFYIS